MSKRVNLMDFFTLKPRGGLQAVCERRNTRLLPSKLATTYVYSLMMSTYCWLSSAARSEAPSRYVAFELSHDAHGEISRQLR